MEQDISKLKRKTSSVVHILSHLKEKIHYLENLMVIKKEELTRLDSKALGLRDHLPGIKHIRDKLKNQILIMKQQFGLLGNIELLRDFEEKVVKGKQGAIF